MVAFAILALTLGVLLRIFGGGTRLAGQATERARAILLAESILAAAGVETPLQVGEIHGEIDDTYRFRLMTTPWQNPYDPLPENMPVQPYWVEVTVEWGENNEFHEFNLSTLRLVPTKDRASPRIGRLR